MGHGKFDSRVALGTWVRASTVITGWNTISQLVVKETPLMQDFRVKKTDIAEFRGIELNSFLDLGINQRVGCVGGN